eukprot:13312142-Alexandrium_andersonii.AAC.1
MCIRDRRRAASLVLRPPLPLRLRASGPPQGASDPTSASVAHTAASVRQPASSSWALRGSSL